MSVLIFLIKILDCEEEREYTTDQFLNTNSYIVHYIWRYKYNLIQKYKKVLKDEKLL